MDLYKYQYRIRDLVITTRNTYPLRDGSASYLSIQHDFINRRLPIIKINVELSKVVIADIYDNLDIAKLSFSLHEQQLDGDGKVINTILYLQHAFTIIPANDRSMYITDSDSVSNTLVDEMRNLQMFEMYLIDMTAVKWFTQQVCTIFTKTSKASALHALIQMRGIPSGITIATPPLDTVKVPNMVLPLGDLTGNIDTINKAYGLYSSYPIIYYDMINLYCIDKVDPNIIMPKTADYGTVTLLLRNSTSAEYQITGSYNDITNRIHYVNLNDIPTITNITKELTSTTFSTVTAVDSNGAVEKTTLDKNATALAYVYKYSEQTVNQVVSEVMTGPSVTFSLSNVAASIFKPYKIFMFNTDTIYSSLNLNNHIFRLRKMGLSITREGSGETATYLHDITVELNQPTLNDIK